VQHRKVNGAHGLYFLECHNHKPATLIREQITIDKSQSSFILIKGRKTGKTYRHLTRLQWKQISNRVQQSQSLFTFITSFFHTMKVNGDCYSAHLLLYTSEEVIQVWNKLVHFGSTIPSDCYVNCVLTSTHSLLSRTLHGL